MLNKAEPPVKGARLLCTVVIGYPATLNDSLEELT
jgi:hypothetical protein